MGCGKRIKRQKDQQFFPDGRVKHFRKWTQKQNQEYANYLLEYTKSNPIKQHSMKGLFFVKMAKELKSNKSNLQCRSHHQKMMKRFKSMDNIIRYFLLPEQSQIKMEQGLKREEDSVGKEQQSPGMNEPQVKMEQQVIKQEQEPYPIFLQIKAEQRAPFLKEQ